MANFHGIWIFLLILHSASSLKCYVCSSTSSNDDCNINSKECKAPLDTCMTTVDTEGKVKAIVKQCSSARTCAGAAGSASQDVNGNGNEVTCCKSHLCNTNTGTSIQLSSWLLTLPTCLLMLVLKHDG